LRAAVLLTVVALAIPAAETDIIDTVGRVAEAIAGRISGQVEGQAEVAFTDETFTAVDIRETGFV
jgi:hypothetical protein